MNKCLTCKYYGAPCADIPYGRCYATATPHIYDNVVVMDGIKNPILRISAGYDCGLEHKLYRDKVRPGNWWDRIGGLIETNVLRKCCGQ